MKLRCLLVIFSVLSAAQYVCGASDADSRDSRFEYFFYEAINQGRRQNYAEAFDLLQYCLTLNPESAAVKYELAQYYILLGDRVRPGVLMREATESEPENYWYWQLLGNYYASVHQYQSAIEIYEKMTAQFPSRTSILINLMSLYEDAGEFRKGLSVLDRIELLEGESISSQMQRFQFYVEMNDVDSAYAVIRPNVQWFIESLSEMVSNINELNIIRQLCIKAVKDFPDNLTLHYWNAVSQYRGGETQLALRYLEDGISHISLLSDSVEAARLYTFRGDIYHGLGNMKETLSSYELALKLNPDDNMTANNYAYFLSLDRRDLKMAERLSRKTIQEEPMNATYLDTYAWILFNQKRYKDALEYILKAVQCIDEPSPDVMEHCGDIYFMNGNSEEAMRFWHQAIELNSTSKTIEQKIIQKKYIEE